MSFMARLLGASSGTGGGAVITDRTATGENLSGIGGTSIAGYKLLNTGVAQATQQALSGGYANITGEWLTSGAAASYEARGTFTLLYGTGGTTAGPTVYTSLAGTQTWTLSNTNNDSSWNLLVEIRPAGGGAVITSANIILEALSAP